MKTFLEQAIFTNVAPFGNLKLNFRKDEITVLTAINGKGKTTILSYIADAFHEIAKLGYERSFQEKENLFYRRSSHLNSLNQKEKLAVFIVFNIVKKADSLNTQSRAEKLSFFELRGQWTKQELVGQFRMDQSVANLISEELKTSSVVKRIIPNASEQLCFDVFKKNVLTYFPSYRYEQPGYLNDPYQASNKFNIQNDINGFLKNPIEVVSGLPAILNWLLDMTIDRLMQGTMGQPTGQSGRPISNINQSVSTTSTLAMFESLLNLTLKNKLQVERVVLAIGDRHSGETRLRIANRDTPENAPLYPSLLHVSSGEAALLSLFGEILRQADRLDLKTNSGIVLIDEVDKHLHIKLQKEVLPKLFEFFPNVQFIVSSHSPFLSMGLAETCPERSRLINLDKNGLSQELIQNELYTEVYDMMVSENERFKENFEILKVKVDQQSRPLIITEGKTDVIHLNKAKKVLNILDEFDFFEVPDKWGDDQLDKCLEALAKVGSTKTVIGIFDRDVPEKVKKIEAYDQPFKKYGKNVFGMCLPKIDRHGYGENISIEHYCPKNLLLKQNLRGNRLFLGEEFYLSGNSKDGEFQTKISQIRNKNQVNGVIDEKVFKSNDLEQISSIAMSKYDFARLIDSDSGFVGDFDFESFRPVFGGISKIINLEG